MAQMSVADLVALATSGDRDAFGELAERYSSMARQVAFRVIPYPNLAQEIAQEAIVQAYLSVGRLKNHHRFQIWLYGIVLNLCRRYLRGKERDRTFSYDSIAGNVAGGDLPTLDPEPGPQEIAEAREIARTEIQITSEIGPEIPGAGISEIATQIEEDRKEYFEALRARIAGQGGQTSSEADDPG